MHIHIGWPPYGFFFGWFIGDIVCSLFLRTTPRDWVKRVLVGVT